MVTLLLKKGANPKFRIAIRGDKELDQLVTATISRGGVQPTATRQILTKGAKGAGKKSKKSKKSKKDKSAAAASTSSQKKSGGKTDSSQKRGKKSVA